MADRKSLPFAHLGPPGMARRFADVEVARVAVSPKDALAKAEMAAEHLAVPVTKSSQKPVTLTSETRNGVEKPVTRDGKRGPAPKHVSAAERQKAYRERKKAKREA